MTILIDDRAGSRDLVKYPPLDEVGELVRLDSGDAAFVGNGPDGPLMVGVEVKSILDLVSSMNTGRLQATQIPAMLDEFDISWLLYYGIYKPSPVNGALQIYRGKKWYNHRIGKRPVPYGYLEQFLMTLTMLGVHVKRVSSESEAVSWIACLYRWWSKDWEKHDSFKAFDTSRSMGLMPDLDEGTLTRAKVASQLPGVGYKRAIAVAQHFDSVRDMINAGPREWEEIPGVGRVVAKAVEEAVR